MKFVAAISFFCLLAGCGESDSRFSHNDENTIVVALRNDVHGFNPGVSRDVFTDDVLLHIYEGLVAYGESGDVKPVLASSVDVDESGLTYRFNLIRNAKFHNGELVTAQIVKWNYERYLRTNSDWLCKTWYDGSNGLEIRSVDIIDEHTVAFTLNKPDASFLDRLANVQCGGFILHPASFSHSGEFTQPIGTGPYKLNRWKTGEFVLLEAHHSYHTQQGERNGLAGAKHPITEFIKWQIVPDSNAAVAGLISSQIDMAGRLQPANLFDLDNAPKVTVHAQQSLDWNSLLLQTQHPLLKDVNLRKGIAHALNLPAMAEVVSAGISSANASIVSSHSLFHDPCHDTGYTFSLEKARALVGASSYNGEPLVLQTNKHFSHMFDNALLIQAMLAKVGINVELLVQEWTTQINNYLKGDFELMSFGFSGRTDPMLAFDAILGDKQTNPYYQWQNAQVRALLNKSMLTNSSDQRKDIFCQVHQKMINDIPMINLYNHYIIDATSNNLRNYRPYALQTPRFWGVSKVKPQQG